MWTLLELGWEIVHFCFCRYLAFHRINLDTWISEAASKVLAKLMYICQGHPCTLTESHLWGQTVSPMLSSPCLEGWPVWEVPIHTHSIISIYLQRLLKMECISRKCHSLTFQYFKSKNCCTAKTPSTFIKPTNLFRGSETWAVVLSDIFSPNMSHDSHQQAVQQWCHAQSLSVPRINTS